MNPLKVNHFENELALEFMAKIEESEDPKKLIDETLDWAIESGRPTIEDSYAVIVCAAYIDHTLNGTLFSVPGGKQLAVDSFAKRHPEVDFDELRIKADEALYLVAKINSTLSLLFDELEYSSDWEDGIYAMARRILG